MEKAMTNCAIQQNTEYVAIQAFDLWPSLKYAPVNIMSLDAKNTAPTKNMTIVGIANW